MKVSYNTGPYEPPSEPRMFPALKIMETQTPPLKYGQYPYWRAPIVPASAELYVPVWNWVNPLGAPQGDPVTVLDVNAAYLSAMGGVDIAHSHLERTGPVRNPDRKDVKPGYYKVTVPHWAFDATIVHPLGDSSRVREGRALWIAAPTLILLLELGEDGHLGAFDVLDSWTPTKTTNFRSWSARLGSYRTECLDRIDTARDKDQAQRARDLYDAFKQGYSAALSMMLTGEKCLTRRPDWAHTVYAQHAASTWRKAWRYTYTGRPLIAMGSVDEIAVLSVDIPEAVSMPRPPFRFDPTGRKPGALKPKRITYGGYTPAQRATTITLIDDEEDVL